MTEMYKFDFKFAVLGCSYGIAMTGVTVTTSRFPITARTGKWSLIEEVKNAGIK